MKLRKNTKTVRSIDSAYREWPKECYSKQPSAISISFKKSSKIILKERVIPQPETQKLLQQILQTVQRKPTFKKKLFESTNGAKSVKFKTYRKETQFGTNKSTSVQVCFLDNLKSSNCDLVTCLRNILFVDEKVPKPHHKQLRIHISQSSRPNSAIDREDRRKSQEGLVSQTCSEDKVTPNVTNLEEPSIEGNVEVEPQTDKCNINTKFKNMISGLTSFLEPLLFDPTLECEAVCLVEKQEELEPALIKRTEKKTTHRRKTVPANTRRNELEQDNNTYCIKEDDVDNLQNTSCLKNQNKIDNTNASTRKHKDFIFPEATSSVMRAKKQEKNPCNEYQKRKGKNDNKNQSKGKETKNKKPPCSEEKPKKESKKREKKKKAPPCQEEEITITRETPPCQNYPLEEDDDPLCQIPECKRDLLEKLFEDCYEKTEGQCGLKPCCTIPPCKREQVKMLLSPTCASDGTFTIEKVKMKDKMKRQSPDSSDEDADEKKELPKAQLELIRKMIEKTLEEKQSSHSLRFQMSAPTSCKHLCASTPRAMSNISMARRTAETTLGLSRQYSEGQLDNDQVPGCPRSCIKLPTAEPECVEDCPSRKKEQKSYCAQKRDDGNTNSTTKKSFCAQKRAKIKPCDDDCKPAKEAGHCEEDCPDRPQKTKRVTHKVTQSDESIGSRSGRESPVYMTSTRSHRNISTRARRESPIHSSRHTEYVQYQESESDSRSSSPANRPKTKSTVSKEKETPSPKKETNKKDSASSDSVKEKRIVCNNESPLCSRCSSKLNANKESTNSETSRSKSKTSCDIKSACCSCSDIKSQKDELPCLKCRDRPRSAGRAQCDVRESKRYRDSDDEYQVVKKRNANSKEDLYERRDEETRKRQEEKRRRRQKEEDRRRKEEEWRQKEEEKARRDEEEREKDKERREIEKQRKEEDRRKKEEERRQRDIENRRKEEEKRKRREIDNKRRQEEERRRQEEERKAKIEEDRRKKNEEIERKREDERRRREEEKMRREEEAERKREEQRRKVEEEQEKREEEKRRREEEKQRREEERKYREEERREKELERQRQKEEERQRQEDRRREKKLSRKRRHDSSGGELCDCHRKRQCPHQAMAAPPPPQQFGGGCPGARGNFGRPPGYYYPFQTYPPTSSMQQGACPFSSNCPFPQNCPTGGHSQMSIPMDGGCMCCPTGGMGGMGRMCPPMGGMGSMCPPMGGMGSMCPPMGGMGSMCSPMGGMGMGGMGMGGMGSMCPMGGMGRMCPPMGGGMGMCPVGTGFGCFGTHNMVGRYYNYCYKICCKTAFCIAAVLATILIILFLI